VESESALVSDVAVVAALPTAVARRTVSFVAVFELVLEWAWVVPESIFGQSDSAWALGPYAAAAGYHRQPDSGRTLAPKPSNRRSQVSQSVLHSVRSTTGKLL
jgi:hypothetical protein